MRYAISARQWKPCAIGVTSCPVRASRWPLRAMSTEGLPWIEIDYPADLERARTEVEPAILALEGVLVR